MRLPLTPPDSLPLDHRLQTFSDTADLDARKMGHSPALQANGIRERDLAYSTDPLQFKVNRDLALTSWLTCASPDCEEDEDEEVKLASEPRAPPSSPQHLPTLLSQELHNLQRKASSIEYNDQDFCERGVASASMVRNVIQQRDDAISQRSATEKMFIELRRQNGAHTVELAAAKRKAQVQLEQLQILVKHLRDENKRLSDQMKQMEERLQQYECVDLELDDNDTIVHILEDARCQ